MRLVHIAVFIMLVGMGIGMMLMLKYKPMEAQIMAEATRYKMAVLQFQHQYQALPGDMLNATEFWGIANGENGNDATCYATDSRTLDDPKRTCNGNGNQEIFHKDNLADQSAPEWFRAWQHLVNAGLIAGEFSGTTDGRPRAAMPGINVPASEIVSGAGYTLMNFHQLDHPKWFPGYYFGLAFGAPFVNPVGLRVETRGGTITSAQALRMDSKFDDGLPRGGIIRSFRDLQYCVFSPGAGQPYHYLSDSTVKGCGLFIAFRDPKQTNAPMRGL